MRDRRVELIGVASGRGGRGPGAELGPGVLEGAGLRSWLAQRGVDADWREIRPASPTPEDDPALDVVADVCRRLAAATQRAVSGGACPLVLGGDHSCAIGTWSGVHNALTPRRPLGLIWIDAHMDSHVPATSPSGNLHGMPVAHLLGHGVPELTGLAVPGPAILPDKLCLIGVRSYEPEEPVLLDRLGVKVYPMEEVCERGFGPVLGEAIARVGSATGAVGVSLDLDAIDPADVPAVGSPVPGGIGAGELLAAFRGLGRLPDLAALEIAEFNPGLDRDGTTLNLIRELVLAAFDGAA